MIDRKGKCVLNVIREFEEVYERRQDCQMVLDKKVRIEEFVKNQNQMVYRYDYGDDWTHEIVIKGTVVDFDKNHPMCMMGESNTPPEDDGGILGFAEFLIVMNDPSHPDFSDMKLWLSEQWYRDFDLDLINRRLKRVLRRS